MPPVGNSFCNYGAKPLNFKLKRTNPLSNNGFVMMENVSAKKSSQNKSYRNEVLRRKATWK